MRDSELRGIILEALYNHRRRDFVDLEEELGGLPVPHSTTESILRQLVKKGLVERPIQPLNRLGIGRITAYGVDVVQGTTSPPVSILLHQRITVQDVQLREGNIQNVVSVTKLNVPVAHAEACQDKRKSSFDDDKPKFSFERVTRWWKHIMEKFKWV